MAAAARLDPSEIGLAPGRAGQLVDAQRLQVVQREPVDGSGHTMALTANCGDLPQTSGLVGGEPAVAGECDHADAGLA